MNVPATLEKNILVRDLTGELKSHEFNKILVSSKICLLLVYKKIYLILSYGESLFEHWTTWYQITHWHWSRNNIASSWHTKIQKLNVPFSWKSNANCARRSGIDTTPLQKQVQNQKRLKGQVGYGIRLTHKDKLLFVSLRKRSQNIVVIPGTKISLGIKRWPLLLIISTTDVFKLCAKHEKKSGLPWVGLYHITPIYQSCGFNARIQSTFVKF